MSTCPTYNDIDAIEKQFKKHATKDQLKMVEAQIEDFVKREEFESLTYENT